jgi:hypothetical protein
VADNTNNHRDLADLEMFDEIRMLRKEKEHIRALLESNPHERMVIPKIAEVVENKKQKILSSLNEYLAETNPSENHEKHLQLIADCEIKICNELLKEFISNFSE